MDGYFAETIFSGGNSFAVFNERFFTPAFAALETVYPSWEVLQEKMPGDLQRLDEPIAYDRCWRQAYDLLTSLYSTDQFRENLRAFYRGEYTLPLREDYENQFVRSARAEELIGDEICTSDETVANWIKELTESEQAMRRERAVLQETLACVERQVQERAAAVEAQVTALRDELAERDAAVAAGETKAGAAEARSAEAMAEIEAQGRRIAENETALAGALQRAEELGERLRAAEAMRDSELVSLRADLAKRALEIHELRDVVAGSRAEAAAQRAAFVRARQEAAERDTAARQETAECDTVIAKMRGEIALLSETLASARQIGPTIGQLFNNFRFLYKKKLIVLADRAREASEWDVAAHYYRRALDRNPKRPEIWIQYGHVLKEAGHLWAAEQAYRQATTEAPALAEPYRYLGDVLSAQRKRDEALTAYRQAHALDPSSPHALSGLRGLGWVE